MIVVIAGPAGVGKSTVAAAVADDRGWVFADADDHHPVANIESMRRGRPLTDEDRRPWLASLRRAVIGWHAAGTDVVLAWSALTHEHRRAVLDGVDSLVVHLTVPRGELESRLLGRRGHFAGMDLIDTQRELHDPGPGEPVVVATGDVGEVVERVVDLVRRSAR